MEWENFKSSILPSFFLNPRHALYPLHVGFPLLRELHSRSSPTNLYLPEFILSFPYQTYLPLRSNFTHLRANGEILALHSHFHFLSVDFLLISGSRRKGNVVQRISAGVSTVVGHF